MSVAGFVEFVVADLPHPIADHVEVHLAVIAQSGIIFARTVAQHRFAESPIASASDKTPAVDEDSQRAVICAVGHLADSRFHRLGVRCLSALEFECQFQVIQIRIAVANRPPQLRVLQAQRRVRRGIELDAGWGLRGANIVDTHFELRLSEASAKSAGDGRGAMVHQFELDTDVCMRDIRQRQGSADK